MIIKFLLAFLIGVLSYTNLLAATITSTGTGLWSVGGTWVGGVAPVNGDNVIIAAGHTVTLDVTRTCNWMEVSGTLIINATITLTVNGCDNANTNFSQQFTIDGVSPGTVTNNGTLLLDQGACGGTPIYENQAGGTFTNNSVFTIESGGDYSENGTFTNTGTVNITSTTGASMFTNGISINNTGGTINVNSGSTFSNIGNFAGGNGTINMNAGSFYNHSQNGGTIPTCTWNSTSTCVVKGITNAAPGGLGQSFGNLTWDCASQSSMNLGGVITTIAGNFTINDINTSASRTLQLTTSTNYTLNIGGNLIIAASAGDILQFATSANPTINVTGNVTISSGKLTMGTTGSPVLNVTGNFTNASSASSAFQMTSNSGNPILNVTGDFTHSSTATTACLMSTGSSTGIGTINIGGNFNYSSGTASLITENNSSTGKGVINFNKAGTQTFSTAVTSPFSETIEVTVNASSTLDMSASTTSLALTGSSQLFTVNGILITGTRTLTAPAATTFILAAAATLNTSNASGVSAAAAGTIQGAGTKTFNNAANYILGGASTTTGFTDNTTMNDLTTTASAVLGSSIIVNGDFLNSAGTFTAGANTITVGDDFTNNGTFAANTSTLNIAGDFSNGGTFTANTGVVVFNGAAAQTIGGASTTTFNNITSSNTCVACGVSLAQNANLIGILTINSRTFTTTGFNFTLVSDASGTASIGPMTAAGADFIGNIIMQRYAPVSLNTNDWRFLGSAVSGRTLADWTDDFATSGFTGATCGPTDCASPGCAVTCTFVSVYTYDEGTGGDLEQGYTEATNVTNPISVGTGFWVYMGGTPLTFDVTGTPNKSSKSLPVSYFDNFDSDNDGWCLVANPYPCAIDWDDADWTKTNMENAVYIYNSTTGTYASYVGGAGLNGGSKNIASQQAFWVKASGDSPVPALTAVEGVKITGVTPTFFKTEKSPNTSNYPMAFHDFLIPLNANTIPNSIKLTANGNGYDDEIILRFVQGATNNFDGQYDAWKLNNPNTAVHNFSSVVAGARDLSINSLPALSANVSIPIRLTVPTTGTYKISRDSILMLPLSSCVTLEDKKTGSMIDLRTVVSYTFTISDTTAAPRFVLHINAPITKQSVNAACVGINTGKAIAQGIGAGPWNYVWKDSGGNIVKTTLNSSTADTLYNCAVGTYSVTVNGAVCGTVSDTIVVKPTYTLSSNISQTNVSCYGSNSGIATVAPSGGTASYSYLWSNNQTTFSATGLLSGNYSVTITDINGCTVTANASITQPTALTSTVAAESNVSCFGGSDGSATVIPSGGVIPYSYLWNNNQTTSSAIGLSAANYSLTITDGNGCTAAVIVPITQPVLLTSTVSPTNVSCFGGSDGSLTVIPSGGISSYSYLWDDNQTTSSITGLFPGNYSLTITDANACIATASASITEPALLIADYTASTYTVDIAVSNSVTFTNNSSGASSYQWNFGDASPTNNSVNPTHAYTLTGTYTVTLIATNGTCPDTISQTITVINSDPTGINGDNSLAASVNVAYDNGEVYLLFSLDKSTKVNISVYNMMGEEIASQNNLLVKNDRVKLSLPTTSAGIYIAVSEMSPFAGTDGTNVIVSKKIFLPSR